MDIDEIYYILNEAPLKTPNDRIEALKNSFPDIKVNESGHNDKYVDDVFVESYAYSRSLGLSMADAAYTAEISFTLLRKLFLGEGLSIDNYAKLIEAELCAAPRQKLTLLRRMERTSESSIDTTVKLLEKAYPKDYGSKAVIEEVKGIVNDVKNTWELLVTNVDKKSLKG